MKVMNSNYSYHSSEHEPTFDDDGSTASSAVFDNLVDEVLDGWEEASMSSSITAIARSELQDLLLVDPEAIRRPVTVPGQPYKYPLNLAIHHNATADVILLLLEADPSVTSLPDGDENQGSLHILLHQQRNHPDILSLVDSFLLAHPSCTQIQDSHGCVPLHTAVFHQAELDIIRHLVIVYPEALRIENHHQDTPVALATQLGAVSLTSAVANFLLESLLTMGN
jgi:hypothetical protein